MIKINYRPTLLCIWVTFLYLLCTANGRTPTSKEKEIVKFVNSANTNWTAGFNNFDYSSDSLDGKPSDEGDDSPILNGSEISLRIVIPKFFDARKYFTKCSQDISYVRHQGNCGSCWANAAASVMTDRICIASNARERAIISVEDIVQCCGDLCLVQKGKECGGGYGWRAFKMWKEKGIVSGGNYNSRIGCKTYTREHFEFRQNTGCFTDCSTPNYKKTYKQAKFYAASYYRLPKDVLAIQKDIMNNGPVMAYMFLYEDYNNYQTGVFRHVTGSHWANHFIKIIGWGVENGEKYWLAINSYGKDWGGLGGDFKILQGTNEANIEGEVRGGKPQPRSARRQMRKWSMETSTSRRNTPLLSWQWQYFLVVLFHKILLSLCLV